MKAYNYIYFKINQILCEFDGNSGFAAIMVLCWLFMFNSFTIFYLVSKRFDVIKLMDTCVSFKGGIVLFGGHLVYFYYQKRFLKIIEKYKNESKNSSAIGFTFVFLYFILSIWIFFKFAAPNMHGILK